MPLLPRMESYDLHQAPHGDVVCSSSDDCSSDLRYSLFPKTEGCEEGEKQTSSAETCYAFCSLSLWKRSCSFYSEQEVRTSLCTA